MSFDMESDGNDFVKIEHSLIIQNSSPRNKPLQKEQVPKDIEEMMSKIFDRLDADKAEQR